LVPTSTFSHRPSPRAASCRPSVRGAFNGVDGGSDWHGSAPPAGAACCGPPRPAREADSDDPATPQVLIGRKVLEGGSHLCAPNYCRRHRPAARWPQPIDTSTSHVGFRCIARR
jgi:formylglycine-generating enzyme